MLRPRRSSFHTTSVSPFPRVLSTRFSPGRSEVFPLILSSNISSHPAHSSEVRCNAVFWSFVDTLTYPISMVLSPAKGRKHATGELDGHSQKCSFRTEGVAAEYEGRYCLDGKIAGLADVDCYSKTCMAYTTGGTGQLMSGALEVSTASSASR